MSIVAGLDIEPDQYGKVQIPDCSRDDLPDFLTAMGYKRGAEIGVRRGTFSEKLCRAGQKVYAIDPWMKYAGYREMSPREMVTAEETARDRLASYDCVIIKQASMDALAQFRNLSLDWVYIDANHSLPYVIQDIYFWSKKVRRGGIISGHDYWQSGRTRMWAVKEAVDVYTKVYGISPWYVIGREEKIRGEKRDRFRSWFWFNK